MTDRDNTKKMQATIAARNAEIDNLQKLYDEQRAEMHHAEAKGMAFVLSVLLKDPSVKGTHSPVWLKLMQTPALQKFITNHKYSAEFRELQEQAKALVELKMDFPAPIPWLQFEQVLECCDEATLRKIALKLMKGK